jgi:hypothetical protein
LNKLQADLLYAPAQTSNDSPARYAINIKNINVLTGFVAPLNSFQIKTPHRAQVRV